MKKIYTLACGILVSGFAFAQQSVPATPGNGRPVNFTRTVPPTAQTSQSIYVDYDFMDEAWQTANTGAYTRYIWDMNMNYDYAAGDTSLKYAIVDFSALYDSYNDPGNPNFTAIPFSTYNTITIDSVFVAGGHENNSGQNDTILCKIIGLNTAGYPQTSTVLNTTSIVGNTSLGDPANDWFTTSVFGFAPAYTINNNTQKFGVMIEYHGATQDTFGIICGFGDAGSGNCTSLPTLPNFAVESNFAPNSYRHDMRFALPPYNLQTLPTSTGADTYYDCDGSGSYSSGSDSENFLQNWTIWVKVTMNGVGVEEQGNTGIALDQNIPNPTNGNTIINYNIANAGNVQLEVYDVTGQLVETVDQGTQLAGRHQIDLNTANYAAGVYYYSLNVDGVKVTRRMVVTK